MSTFYHVGLTVKNLARSISFNCDVVGMEKATTEDDWVAKKSAAFDLLTNNPGAELRGALLKLDGFTLQLLEYAAGGGDTLALRHNNVGTLHLSTFVPDVD